MSKTSELLLSALSLLIFVWVLPNSNTRAAYLPVHQTDSPPEARTAARSVLPPAAKFVQHPSGVSVETSEYGKTAAGKPVTLFTCRNSKGSSISLIDYGATMVSMELPDRNGKLANVILTCPDMNGWEKCKSYFGCVAGRFCNRIAKGTFTLDGKDFQLAVNNGPNHLHGGVRGFDKQMWKGEPIVSDEAVGVRFRLESSDGDENYPGKLTVTADYTLTHNNELHIEFRATTDAPTPVNLTNHNYWNLAGHNSGTHVDQELMVVADKYLENDSTAIPTGKFLDVAGTPLDFLTFRKIGERLTEVGDPEAKGYDHCFAVRDFDGSLRHVATVRDPRSGRQMEIHSTQPGLQFYTGNFLDGTEGSGGYKQYSGFCLETQHYPDSPNRPEFPSAILKPGMEFVHKTIHRFSVNK